jgi:hypothetical protein
MPGTLFPLIREVIGRVVGFPQSLQAGAEILAQLGYDRFLPSPFQFIIGT